MNWRLWLCKKIGHKKGYCENDCGTHGFCKRCGYFWRGEIWYPSWRDTIKTGT